MKYAGILCLLLLLITGCDSSVSHTGGATGKTSGESSDPGPPPPPDISVLEVKIPAIGEPLAQVRERFQGFASREEPAWNYGLDGGGSGITILKDEEPLFFYFRHWEKPKIGGVVVVSPRIRVADSFHVGMSAGEVLEKYPDIKILKSLLEDNVEFCLIPRTDIALEFHDMKGKNTVARYDRDEYGFFKFAEVENPLAKVTRITLLNR